MKGVADFPLVELALAVAEAISSSTSVSRSVSVAVSPSVAAGVGGSGSAGVAIADGMVLELALLLACLRIVDGNKGVRFAMALGLPYMRSISGDDIVNIIRFLIELAGSALTWIFEEDEECELRSVCSQTNKQDGIAPSDKRQAVVPSIPCKAKKSQRTAKDTASAYRRSTWGAVQAQKHHQKPNCRVGRIRPPNTSRNLLRRCAPPS